MVYQHIKSCMPSRSGSLLPSNWTLDMDFMQSPCCLHHTKELL